MKENISFTDHLENIFVVLEAEDKAKAVKKQKTDHGRVFIPAEPAEDIE